jgi:CheY-like chemotaxis protein
VADSEATEPRTAEAPDLGRRVVVVDDYPAMRALLRAMLEGRGCRVVAEGGSGHDAIDMTAGECDILVLDLHMPGMDGLVATAAIRRERPGLEIVAFSSDDALEDEVLAAGASRYFNKTRLTALVDYVAQAA